MFVFLYRYGSITVATAVFTSPINKYFGKGAVELARLVRVPAFDAPLSRFVAKCLRWLKKNTKLLYCLSYADSTVGHCGFIYQACNFTFVRKSKGNVMYRHKSGKLVSGRSFDQHAVDNKEGYTRMRSGAKFLYVYPLAEKLTDLTQRFGWSSLPYPKTV
jgi:hypothetical protein